MREELEAVTIEFDEATGIGYLTFNRPDTLNSLNIQLREDIVAGLKKLIDLNDESVKMRVVIVEGAENNFCAGADISEFGDDTPTPVDDRTHYEFLLDYPLPVIAKIRGYCLGGGLETALSCDFRFAGTDAALGLPEVDLGLIPGAGGVQYISKLANPSIAKEIAMTGETITAERAQEIDLINGVHDDEELDGAVEEFAGNLASKPPLAIQAIKDSADIARQTGLREGRRYDLKAIEPLFASNDHSEAAKAFSEEDYEPEYTGS